MLRIVLLAFSLAAGIGAAWLWMIARGAPASQVAAPVASPAPVAPATTAAEEVLVAAVDLTSGQTLVGDSIRWQAWPESALHPSHITRRQEPDAANTLLGKAVQMQIGAGEPIRRGAFVAAKPGALSASLRTGHRAVAVRITAENTAGGFILPNDRVDVIVTVAQEGRKEGDRRHVSRTILKNVLVLAIDQSAEDRPLAGNTKEEKATSKPTLLGRTATLEVTPPQAEALAAGEAMGMLSLALRPPFERDEPVAGPSEAVAAAAVAPVHVMRGAKIVIIRAGQ
jgi:pilus assembly protein CpaB